MSPPLDAPARPVGPLQLLALGLNGIVGVGIFFVPASVAASAPGFGAVGVFALTVLPLVLLVLAFALAWGRFPAPAMAAPDFGWLRAALSVVFACQGFEIVPVIAGQVRASSRAVPIATVGSLVLAIGLYLALVLARVTALPPLAAP